MTAIDEVRGVLKDHLSRTNLIRFDRYARLNSGLYIAAFGGDGADTRLILESSIKEAIFTTSREIFIAHTIRNTPPYAGHVARPEVLAYSLAAGDFLSEEVALICVGPDHTIESFVEKCNIEDLPARLIGQLFHPSRIEEFNRYLQKRGIC